MTDRDQMFKYAEENWDKISPTEREELRYQIRGISSNVSVIPDPFMGLNSYYELTLQSILSGLGLPSENHPPEDNSSQTN